METAPRNCRFLSLVVVERVLTWRDPFRSPSETLLGSGGSAAGMTVLKIWAVAENDHQNSCQSRFSGVYLAFEVFQERESKQMLAAPYSRFTSVYLVLEVFQTKLAHFCFCLVRIKMPLLIWGAWMYKDKTLQMIRTRAFLNNCDPYLTILYGYTLFSSRAYFLVTSHLQHAAAQNHHVLGDLASVRGTTRRAANHRASRYRGIDALWGEIRNYYENTSLRIFFS